MPHCDDDYEIVKKEDLQHGKKMGDGKRRSCPPLWKLLWTTVRPSATFIYSTIDDCELVRNDVLHGE